MISPLIESFLRNYMGNNGSWFGGQSGPSGSEQSSGLNGMPPWLTQMMGGAQGQWPFGQMFGNNGTPEGQANNSQPNSSGPNSNPYYNTYQGSPYGQHQAPHGQSPFGQPPSGQSTHGQSQNGANHPPYGTSPFPFHNLDQLGTQWPFSTLGFNPFQMFNQPGNNMGPTSQRRQGNTRRRRRRG